MTVKKIRRGFTLLELIIYVGITAVVVVSLTSVMLTVFETRENTQAQSIVQHSLRMASDQFAAQIISAQALESKTANTLTLEFSDDEREPLTYSILDGTLYVNNAPLTPPEITVSSDPFTLIDEHTVHIELEMSDGKEESSFLPLTFTLRST